MWSQPFPTLPGNVATYDLDGTSQVELHHQNEKYNVRWPIRLIVGLATGHVGVFLGGSFTVECSQSKFQWVKGIFSFPH